MREIIGAYINQLYLYINNGQMNIKFLKILFTEALYEE